MLPSIVFTDIDGVWTDGGMYYSTDHSELKKFNTSDSAGVMLLRYYKVPVVIITGEDNNAVRDRARKIGIDLAGFGIKNKLDFAENICRKIGVDINSTAYIGDDIYDIPLLKKVLISACPENSSSYVKNVCGSTIPVQGGNGAFRYFVEEIILGRKLTEQAVEGIIESL